MHEIIESIRKKYNHYLGDNDSQFLKRVYNQDLAVYETRLRNINFYNKKKVLDAGCGFGQWSIALANLNDSVSSIDIQSDRLFVLDNIVSSLEINNIDIMKGTLINLPYEDNSFEAVFCYGVIFCTDWKKAVREFYRVLEPGGTLYFTANEIGWYLKLWVEEYNKTEDYSPREIAAQSLLNTVNYNKYGMLPEKGQVLITQQECRDVLAQSGFKTPLIDGEGKINFNTSPSVSFFDDKYDNKPACYEVLAVK